jgi:hypothetical protein
MDHSLDNSNDFWYRDISFTGVNVNDYRQFVYNLSLGLDNHLVNAQNFSYANLKPGHGLNYWDQYNIFQYQNEIMYDLLQHIKGLLSKACTSLNIEYDAQKYHIHGWVDVYNGEFNETDINNLNWYDEAMTDGVFAGMFMLDAEDSSNYYMKNGEIKEIENTPGRLNLFTNYKWFHGKWTENRPKIIFGFSIYPLSSLPPLEDYVTRYIPI